MIKVGSELGMNIPRPQHRIEHNKFITEDQIDKYLRDFMMKKVHLVIVVLANSSENYGM